MHTFFVVVDQITWAECDSESHVRNKNLHELPNYLRFIFFLARVVCFLNWHILSFIVSNSSNNGKSLRFYSHLVHRCTFGDEVKVTERWTPREQFPWLTNEKTRARFVTFRIQLASKLEMKYHIPTDYIGCEHKWNRISASTNEIKYKSTTLLLISALFYRIK